jgi:hypothetical protein
MADEKLISHLDEFRSEIQDRVEEMRRHDNVIDRYCAAQPSVEPVAGAQL